MSDKVTSVSSNNVSVVEKMMKRSKHGKSSRSSKSGKSGKSSRSLDLKDNSSPKSSGILSSVMKMYNNNPKIFWGGIVLITLAAIWYYNNQKAKQMEEEEKKQNLENENKQKIENYENLMKTLEEEHNNGIVKIKLPERFLQDEQGRPIVLTPAILQDIQKKAQSVTKNDSESDDSDDDSSEEELVQQKKNTNQIIENEVPNTEEFVEEKDLKQQDLTNDEMDQIRQQLEMMNNSNNIVASNT
jgi:hypothetical protein